MKRLPRDLLSQIAIALSLVMGLYSLTVPFIQMTPMVGLAIWLGVLGLATKKPHAPAAD